ncbi:claudin-34-like [Clarias gariepinus]|uniref:claudin-34-like n=1 Tax=Clarias gariepinus TaxID=13013 RepID=UPI00234E2E8D|nr:claudin-34-like [Clarias gariepinus]
MPYLAHTAHAQFVGLWVSATGWILTIVTVGLVEWRVWEVSDLSVISSGLAWVGIWRVCFFSNVLVTSQYEVVYCQRMQLTDAYTPSEIAAAQVLMLLAFILGLFGNSSVIYGLRNVYFGVDETRSITLAFSFGGGLLLLAGVTSLIPLFWNLNAVVTNQTINFPPNFYMPPAPHDQYVGPGIAVGIFASIMVVLSGTVFLCYKLPEGLSTKISPSRTKGNSCGLIETGMADHMKSKQMIVQSRKNFSGIDNRAFQSQKDG